MMRHRWKLAGIVLAIICAGVAVSPTRGDKILDERVKRLISQLKDGDKKTRRMAAESLGDLGPAAAKAVGALMQALKDKQGVVRHFSAWALGKIGPDARGAASALVRCMKDKDGRVRHLAAWSLGEINAPASQAGPALVKAINDKNQLVRRYATQSLGALDPAYTGAVEPLVKLLGGSSAELAQIAAVSLGRMGPAAADAIGPLQKLLKIDDRKLRYTAAMSLGKIGSAERSVLPIMIEMLSDENPDVRLNAALAIGNMGPSGVAATEALARMVKDKDHNVRYGAMVALGSLGPAAGSAAPTLLDAFRRIKGPQRWDAVSALVRMKRGNLAVADLRKVLKAKEPKDRREAAIVLCAIGRGARPAGEDLRALATDPDEAVRVAAGRALLSVIGDRETAVPVLIPAMRDSKNADIRSDAAMGLGMVGSPPPKEVVPALIAAMKDRSEWVRWQAIRSLGRLGTDAAAAQPAMMAALKDIHQEVRSAAATALDDIELPPRRQFASADGSGGPGFMVGGDDDPTVLDDDSLPEPFAKVPERATLGEALEAPAERAPVLGRPIGSVAPPATTQPATTQPEDDEDDSE